MSFQAGVKAITGALFNIQEDTTTPSWEWQKEFPEDPTGDHTEDPTNESKITTEKIKRVGGRWKAICDLRDALLLAPTVEEERRLQLQLNDRIAEYTITLGGIAAEVNRRLRIMERIRMES